MIKIKNKQLVILAGGYGSRLSEETMVRPKPMVEIGGIPIILHIMSYYSAFGVNDFIICAGYKASFIKDYFKLNKKKKINLLIKPHWNVKIVDTGLKSLTAKRIKKIEKYIEEENFFLTYGDGLSNVDLKKLFNHHYNKGKLVTVTAVLPPPRFGSLVISKNSVVKKFSEKPSNNNNFINGGFFVINKKAIDLIPDFNCSWEKEPLEKISKLGQLVAFKHKGFWQPMDTLRDKEFLEDLYKRKTVPWIK